MSRNPELSQSLVKREMEAALRQAGLSLKSAKIAVSVFSRFIDQEEPETKKSFFGKTFSKLKRKLNRTPEPLRSGMLSQI